MRPDAHAAMCATLLHGPGHCPPALFAGDVAAIVRGLKVHANQINHARHVAIEETYPRLRARVGTVAFHERAATHLASGRADGKSLDAIGEGFERVLREPEWRDLARVELAWLQAYHARDAAALTMAEVAEATPEQLLDMTVERHPAARLVAIEEPGVVPWDEPLDGEGGYVLVTRPGSDVILRRIGDVLAWNLCRKPARIGGLLDAGVVPGDLAALVAAGALVSMGEDI